MKVIHITKFFKSLFEFGQEVKTKTIVEFTDEEIKEINKNKSLLVDEYIVEKREEEYYE